MLKDVEIGVKFYKELGKLEKQLAKYQSKVLEIKKQMREIKKQYSQAKKDEKLTHKYVPNDELKQLIRLLITLIPLKTLSLKMLMKFGNMLLILRSLNVRN